MTEIWDVTSWIKEGESFSCINIYTPFSWTHREACKSYSLLCLPHLADFKLLLLY